MCQINYKDPVMCERCDGVLAYNDSERVPCPASKLTGVSCAGDDCQKSYAKYKRSYENGQTRATKPIRSWLNCPRCSGHPDVLMESLSLSNKRALKRDKTYFVYADKADPFPQFPKSLSLSSPRPMRFALNPAQVYGSDQNIADDMKGMTFEEKKPAEDTNLDGIN